MTFGEKIRAARKGKRLTQQQLAERAKTTVMTISNWERDIVATPDAGILRAVALELGLSIDDLLDAVHELPGQTERLESLGDTDDMEIAIRRAGLGADAARNFRAERRLGGSAYPLEVLIAIAKERRAEELGRSTGKAQVEHVADDPDAPSFR